jgi:hypothetical protein
MNEKDEAFKKEAARAQENLDDERAEARRLQSVDDQRARELYKNALTAFSAPIDQYVRRGTGDLRGTAYEFAAMFAKVGMFTEAEHLLASVNAYLQFSEKRISYALRDLHSHAAEVKKMHEEAEGEPSYLREG